MSDLIFVPSRRPNLSSLVHINRKTLPLSPSSSPQPLNQWHSQQSSPIVCSEPLSVRPPSRNTLWGSTDTQFYPERLKVVEKLSPSLLCTAPARQALTHQRGDGWTENKIWSSTKSGEIQQNQRVGTITSHFWDLQQQQRKQCSLQQTAKISKNAGAARTGAWGAACPRRKSGASHKSDVQEVG